MLTADLPVGSHVAYDRNKSRRYPSYVEAYVIDHRPKGGRYSYYGSNGNSNTVGIAYNSPWRKDVTESPIWNALWVRPHDIYMLWDEYLVIVEKQKIDQTYRDKIRKVEQEARQVRLDAIPQVVLEAFELGEWGVNSLVERNSSSIYLSIDQIEAVIRAARYTGGLDGS